MSKKKEADVDVVSRKQMTLGQQATFLLPLPILCLVCAHFIRKLQTRVHLYSVHENTLGLILKKVITEIYVMITKAHSSCFRLRG